MLLSENEHSEKGYILYDSKYMTFWKRQKYRDSKNLNSGPGLKEEGRVDMQGWGVSGQESENTLDGFVMIGICYTFVQIHSMYNIVECELKILSSTWKKYNDLTLNTVISLFLTKRSRFLYSSFFFLLCSKNNNCFNWCHFIICKFHISRCRTGCVTDAMDEKEKEKKKK